MPTKNEALMIYIFLFVGAMYFAEEGASWITKVQYGIAAVASVKLLNRLFKWLDEWYLFLGGVVASAAGVYFIAPNFFILFAIIATIYVVLIFHSAYKLNKDYDKGEGFPRPAPGIAKIFRDASHELQEKYK